MVTSLNSLYSILSEILGELPYLERTRVLINWRLYHHRKEIWYVAKEGTITDIILKVYEKLVSGEWKIDAKETYKEKGDR